MCVTGRVNLETDMNSLSRLDTIQLDDAESRRRHERVSESLELISNKVPGLSGLGATCSDRKIHSSPRTIR